MLSGELQPIYRRIAPEIAHENLAPKVIDAVGENLDKLDSSGLFRAPVARRLQWVDHYTTDAYVALLGTASNHRMLSEGQRAALHVAIAGAIDARGGEIEHPYRTDLVAAQVK